MRDETLLVNECASLGSKMMRAEDGEGYPEVDVTAKVTQSETMHRLDAIGFGVESL